VSEGAIRGYCLGRSRAFHRAGFLFTVLKIAVPDMCCRTHHRENGKGMRYSRALPREAILARYRPGLVRRAAWRAYPSSVVRRRFIGETRFLQMPLSLMTQAAKLNTTAFITPSLLHASSYSARSKILTIRLIVYLWGVGKIASRHTSYGKVAVLLKASSPLALHQHHSTSIHLTIKDALAYRP
jgi:hypothetical protein